MKRILVEVLLFAVVTGVAQAAPVTVDFSVLGADSYSITVPDFYTLDGVTFTYDNLGNLDDVAQIDAYGVFGTTYGNLIFNFLSPVSAVNFDFTMIGVYGPVNNALSVAFKNAGSSVGGLTVPASEFELYDPGNPLLGGDACGTLSYSGAAFDQALISFSADAPYFSIDSLTYTPAPEPSALAVLAVGLLGLPGIRLARRKR